MSFTADDERFMRMALREAEKAFDEKEIPIGCVIVKDGVVIGKGHNQIEMLKDATAHAEILSIGTAASSLENWRLDGCTLYVTLEPCPMCAGAILNSRISRFQFWKIVYSVFLSSPQNSPGQNTGLGSLSLFQGIFPTQGSNQVSRIVGRSFTS